MAEIINFSGDSPEAPDARVATAMLSALYDCGGHWTEIFKRAITREDYWFVISNLAVQGGGAEYPVRLLSDLVRQRLQIDARTVESRLSELDAKDFLTFDTAAAAVRDYNTMLADFDAYGVRCLETLLTHTGISRIKAQKQHEGLDSVERARLVKSVFDHYGERFKTDVIDPMNRIAGETVSPLVASRNIKKLFTATAWYALGYLWQGTVQQVDIQNEDLWLISYRSKIALRTGANDNSVDALFKLLERFGWVRIEKDGKRKMYLMSNEVLPIYTQHLLAFDKVLKSETGPLLAGFR